MACADVLASVLERIDQEITPATARLQEFLRIPSISTDPAFASECARAANWLVQELISLGISAEAHETPGHPMVVGHAKGPEGTPHILFYGHYDVQPVDPLELWDTDPFDPQIQDTETGKIIRARGASDDKGQLMTFVEALRAWVAETGEFPCSITIFFEGEEESGSPSLVPYLQKHAESLRADLALICDTGLFADTRPAIVTMLRGLLGEEITIHAANKDLHSGMYGGIAMNPVRVLAKIIAGLHDDAGRITIDGFYDGVPELSNELAAQWDDLGFDPAKYLGDVGLGVPAGERGRRPLEMMWSRPTCDVNGISGGYAGDGFKTVLPAQASAKISFRLVGTQDPHKIREAFRAYVRAQLPEDCTVDFGDHGASPAATMATAHPIFDAARRAVSTEWDIPAAFVGCGGSIPIAGYFQDILGMDSMLLGFAKDDDQIHSPNEKYDLESFHKGIRSWARILHAIP